MEVSVQKNFEGKRVDNFAADAFFEEYYLINEKPLTRSIVQKNIENRKIKVNNSPTKPSYKLRAFDVVRFEIEKPESSDIPKPENIPLEILYEDDYLIVLNKPKEMLSHPTSKNEGGTLVNALLFHTKCLSDTGGKIRQGIVHRLDRNTSGLMIAAKTNEAHIKLQKDIQDKKTIRKYLAVCHGVIEKDEGTIDKPLVHYLTKTVKMNTCDNGLSAVTHYRVLERFDNATFIELRLETGRTHQIRCHMQFLGHPLVGDDLYGAKSFQNGIFKNLKTKGQVLMSYYLSFTHPVSSEIMEFKIDEKNYHPDLKKVLALLRSIK